MRNYHRLLSFATLAILSISALPSMAAQLKPSAVAVPVNRSCMNSVQALADQYRAHTMTTGLFVSGKARWKGVITNVGVATREVVTAAAFVGLPPQPFAVYQLDSASIPDATVLATAISEYTTYVKPHVALNDCQVWIDWVAADGTSFSTLALAKPTGGVKFEPLADMVAGPVGTDDTKPLFTDLQAAPTGTDTDTWENLIGVTKAWASLSVSALGANGCTASFTGSFTTGSAFPFIVEPASGEVEVTTTCFPKVDCVCKGEQNKMECGQASKSYNVIARIGTQWFGADLVSYSGTVKAWACADGQSGSGNW